MCKHSQTQQIKTPSIIEDLFQFMSLMTLCWKSDIKGRWKINSFPLETKETNTR